MPSTESKCKFCNTPIREHEAGRCLDAMVYKLKEQSDFSLHKDWEKQVKKGGLIGFANFNKHGDGWENIYTEEIPHYSTDLNHAIELWHPMWNTGMAFGSWIIYRNIKHPTCKAGTLALAICRAYLIEEMKEENNG